MMEWMKGSKSFHYALRMEMSGASRFRVESGARVEVKASQVKVDGDAKIPAIPVVASLPLDPLHLRVD